MPTLLNSTDQGFLN